VTDIIQMQDHIRVHLVWVYLIPYLLKVIFVLVYFINFLGIPHEVMTSGEKTWTAVLWILITIPMSWLLYTESL